MKKYGKIYIKHKKEALKMGKTLKERKDVDQSLTWDLSAIYKTEEHYNLAVKETEKIALEIETDYKGRLNCASVINECLDKMKKALQQAMQTLQFQLIRLIMKIKLGI